MPTFVGLGGCRVRPSHPWQALVFIYAVDLTAIVLLAVQWPYYWTYDAVQWFSAIVFAAVMAAARTMPVEAMEDNNILIQYGWYMAVEFAMIATLPVPLACLAHVPACPAEMLQRYKVGRKEVFRGPDYNASASVICAFVAGHFLEFMLSVTGAPAMWVTLMLLPTAALFMLVQYSMLQVLVMLDRRVPWYKTGLLHLDSIIGDVIMTLVGALIGRLYVLDRSAILLTIVPLALLQRTLERIQQARMVNYDSKTWLYNYRYLDQALNEEVRKATQSGRPLSLIFGDMDYLRDINNTYGHLVGDRALRAVAKVFKRYARSVDVPARFGGEEFVLLLPGMTRQEGWEIAERIRRDVAAERLQTEDGGSFSVTISIGLATFPEDATTVQQLIKAADEAVYEAKRLGKNRVCVYGSGVAV